MRPFLSRSDTYRRSLRSRLIVATILVEVLMLGLLVGNSLRLANLHLVRMAEGRLSELEEAFSISLAGPLAARDHANLRSLVDRLITLDDIAYLALSDSAGQRLAAAGLVPATLPPPDALVSMSMEIHNAVVAVELFDQTMGTLHYGMSTDFLKRARRDLITQGLTIAALEVLLSAVVLSAIAFLLTRRLESLTYASVRIAAGDYRAMVPEGGNDEVAALSRAFNAMTEAVRSHVDELERTAEALRCSNEELARLAEVTAHHLQEPLRHVASYAQLLGSRYHGRLDREADEFIRYMVAGVQQMKTMLVELQAYIAVDVSPVPASARADLAACLAEARHDLAGMLATSEVSVTAGPLPVVRGDHAQLALVFRQLLENAIVHGGHRVSVTVSAEWLDGRATVCVGDTGPGIEPCVRTQVFELFRGKSLGTGIGLPMAKKIVRRHGGHAWIQANGNRGTCVCFTLPVDQREGRAKDAVARPAGFEPATCRLEGGCSIQLS